MISSEQQTLKLMGRPITEFARFPVSDTVYAVTCSLDAEHICIVFYANKKRICSFASDGPGRTSFFSEKSGVSTAFGGTLSEAIAKAEELAKEL